jgi:PKD repeat protein
MNFIPFKLRYSVLFKETYLSAAAWCCNKTLRIFLLIAVSALFAPFSAFSLHIIGGEMTYRFVSEVSPGINRYEFTLVVYRDCDSGGGSLDNPARIGVYRGNSNGATFVSPTRNINLQSIQNVAPVIPPCADASAVSNACVQRGIYVFTLDLPVLADESYFIVYQRCCRTTDIVNLPNPGSLGATYMVELTPAAQALQNSSPIFTNYPPTFICGNFPLNFDHSATDADGDSLVYEFCRLINGGGQNGGGGGCNTPVPNPPCGPPFTLINFLPNYSVTEPMGGNPVVRVDPVSGKLSGTPALLGQFVVGICVKEYRNGQLLSTVLRDFQFNVVDCSPTVLANVVAEEVTGPQLFTVKRCGTRAVTIINQSPQTPDLVTWQWEFDLGNGNIFTSNAWNAGLLLPDFGEYTGRLYLNRNLSCEDTAFITLRAFPGSTADFDFSYDICKETPVQFTDSSLIGANGGLADRRWIFGSLGDTLTEPNPAVQFPAYGLYPVKLVITDADGCTAEKSAVVNWNPKLPPNIPPLAQQKLCLPQPAVFNLFDTINLSGSTIRWDFGDGNFSSEISPQHVYDQEGFYDVSVRIVTALDCVSADTFPIAVRAYDPPVADFDFSPKNNITNLENRVRFNNLSSPDVATFFWEFGKEGTSYLPAPVYFFQDTGLAEIKLTVYNGHGCLDSTSRRLDVAPLLRLYIPNAFAPQSDSGLDNNEFGVLGIIPGYLDFHLSVWSRWGELVFDTDDAGEYWNGRHGNTGNYLPPGVYVYAVTVTGPRGEEYSYEGTVMVF